LRTFNAILAVADISGYTRFVVMHRSSIAHAEQIVSELLETVTQNATVPLKLQKLEGDAAFLVAEVTGPLDIAVNDVMRQVVRFMEQFRQKKQELFEKSVGGCPCTACQSIEKLGLKTVVHQGEVLEKKMGGLTELAGEPVIVAHRLLKNSVEGSNYILTTDEVAPLLETAPYATTQKLTEKIDDVGTVKVTVYRPEDCRFDRGGVQPFRRFSACAEAVRLFVARGLAKLSKPRRPFQNFPT